MLKTIVCLALAFLFIGLVCNVALSATADAATPQLLLTPTTVTITSDGTPVLRYRYADVPYKVYADELCTPSGVNILRDSPPDHKHHHGLMYAIEIDGVNFWEEQKAPGHEVHRGFTWVDDRRETTGFVEQVDWNSPEGKTLANETRRIVALPDAAPDVTLISWTTTLAVPEGMEQVELEGSHYHGLGMRFLESMDKEGDFRYAGVKPGEIVRGDERLTRAPWCAFTSKADGKTVTVAMFDDPANARHPAYWFTMHTHFAYMSATLNLYREPMVLKAGAPLTLHYGVAVWDGRPSDKTITDVSEAWLEAGTKE